VRCTIAFLHAVAAAVLTANMPLNMVACRLACASYYSFRAISRPVAAEGVPRFFALAFKFGGLSRLTTEGALTRTAAVAAAASAAALAFGPLTAALDFFAISALTVRHVVTASRSKIIYDMTAETISGSLSLTVTAKTAVTSHDRQDSSD
jgi:hypothetical protein